MTEVKENLINNHSDEAVAQKRNEINLYRVLSLIASILYPIFGYLNTFVLIPQYESIGFFYQRLLWGLIAFIILITSYFIKVVKENYYQIMISHIYVLNIHIFYLGASNGFTSHHTIGVLFVIMGSAFVMKNAKLLNVFLSVILITSIISITTEVSSELPPVKLMLVFTLICAFLYFVLGSKFKLEQILKKSHANISALINNTNDMIWSIDNDYKYIAFNKSFENITFMLTGKNPIVGELTLVERTEKELGQKLKTIYKEGLLGNAMTVEQELTLNNNLVYMSVSSKPIKLPNNNIIGVTIFGHNITKAKLAEQEINQQKLLLEEHQKEILSSISYAERIQTSLLASKKLLDENLKEYFVYFQPKDIVSGDFYWASKLRNNQFALVTADSTGHGVPGAIMSILNISCIEKAIEVEKLIEPAHILNHSRTKIIETLKKDGSIDGGKDGMDCSIISLDFKNQKITYSAANNPVLIIRNSQIIELLPDKMPVGKHDNDSVSFEQHTIDFQKQDVIYTLTDGMPDQFGGPKGKKFMYKKLKELLISISEKGMSEQKEIILQTFNEWRGDLEQVDDVTLIGIRV